MKNLIVFIFTFLLSGFISIVTVADADEAAVCPVSGKPATKVATEYHGGEVYFCCKNCLKAFAADSDKYSVKANEQLVKTGQAIQEKCPISGGKVKQGTALEVDGIPVAFCCKNCRKKVDQATGDAKLALVFGNEAFRKGFAVGE
tara:strand:+ start:660 stop:1094 length:435 start_codon:yes stop_codon:yes gene_type:complete